ncbi:MAG TPA: ABC transporter substrate-binding protein [Terriglobales bacterium]|jgi:iron complex transport system substrate-binding protein|nr:ABC transporter substrate-binding protein [Terriglobales bacterium]
MQADFSPQRVVSLQPSASVILAHLGMLDRLVACTRYCKDVVPDLGGITIVSDSWTAQAEQIIAAGPELVIAAVPYQLESVAQILKAGIRFLGLAPKSLADIYTDIAAIAGVMGASDRGQKIISEMQREIAAACARNHSTSPKPRVFCEEWGKPIIHSQRWVAELVEAAGGEFVGEPGAKTEAEAVRRSDPDVIVMAWCGAGDRVPLEKVLRERRWHELRAARQRRVYCISDELLNTPAPTLLDGLCALEMAIHPERHPQMPRGIRGLAESNH